MANGRDNGMIGVHRRPLMHHATRPPESGCFINLQPAPAAA
jgi:hypothetical protein